MDPDSVHSQGTVLVNDLSLFRQRSGIASYAGELLAALERSDESPTVVRLSALKRTLPLRWGMLAYRQAMRQESPEAREAPSAQGATRPLAWLARGGATLATGTVRRFGHAALEGYLELASLRPTWRIYHEPDAIPVIARGRTLVTVHDLSVLRFPQWHPAHRVQRYERQLSRGIRSAERVIAVSEATKRDIVEMLGLSPDRIDVVPEAPRSIFRPLPGDLILEARRRRGLPARFFLFVGTIEPRKNVAGLVEAYGKLPAALRRQMPLVLAGGWGWRSEELRRKLGGDVRYLGFVSDGELVALCNAATVMVYPSFHEGFGLPPLEAMACGTPVVTTRRGALAETVGEAARIVEPDDVDAMAAAMRELAESDEARKALASRGKAHVERFSWTEAARRTREVYRKMLA